MSSNYSDVRLTDSGMPEGSSNSWCS